MSILNCWRSSVPNMSNNDKLIERARYESRAKEKLAGTRGLGMAALGSSVIPASLQTPYLAYEKAIAELVKPGDRVLELGAGTGLHTSALLRTGAEVVASDLSPSSLQLLQKSFEKTPGRLSIEVADMERLPFASGSFDVIACAGSLSYGEPALVNAEIARVLRPGGMLICVDTLNHNPIYRLNRWLHYLRGDRSISTLKRMPGLERINSLSGMFAQSDVRYFGAISFLMPVVSRLSGQTTAKALSDGFDTMLGVRRSAFKFVLVGRGFAGSRPSSAAH